MRCALTLMLLASLASAYATAAGIDFNFISKEEGGQLLYLYVPPSSNNSGVTVATGVDLGERSEASLKALGLDDSLVKKLKPYCGKKGDEARKLIEGMGKKDYLTKPEADALDKAVHDAHAKNIAKTYDDAVKDNPKLKKFAALPDEAQTAIASVAYQYGNLPKRTPNFWKLVTAQDWKAAVRELYNFKDAYEPRRFREGDLLATLVPDLPKITDKVGKGAKNNADDVKVVQQLLMDKNAYSGPINGTADQATLKAIVEFQKKIGIPKPDGVIDVKGKTMHRLIGN